MNEPAQRLADCRVMLLFTPNLVPGVTSLPGEESDPEIGRALRALEQALDARSNGLASIGAVQLRIKDAHGRSPARATYTWALRLLDYFAGHPTPPLFLINDRVDVALALAGTPGGVAVAGVHLGQTDLPIAAARELLGPEALIGRSTHDFAQVVLATEEGANYLGFGPVYATETKGYTRGLGPEQAWIAATATGLPLFPIGGISAANAGELGSVGRAAVSSAILSASDPRIAAAAIGDALLAD